MIPKQKVFEATVRLESDAVIIDLQGEINSFAESAMNDAYSDAESHNPSVVLLNFNKVDYINSTGIALIVGLLARARKSKRLVKTYGLSEHYIEIFKITRLSDFMQIVEDEEQALAHSEDE